MNLATEQSEKIKKIWRQKAEILGYDTAAALMSSLYQVDFEAYMITLELTDSKGVTLDYFTFPIMPNELSIREDIPVKIENTFGGVNSISSNVFSPKEINLSGSFGRQFRLLFRNKLSIPLSSKAIQERDYGVNGIKRKQLELSNNLKTGFGCIKVLQSIVNRAVEVDQYDECNKLYMYNMAYGESYVVKPISFRGHQNVSNSGIWQYDLSLRATCPLHLDAHKSGNSFRGYTTAITQSAMNVVLGGIRQTFNVND